jgi:hypothetical protein
MSPALGVQIAPVVSIDRLIEDVLAMSLIERGE